MLLDLLFPKLCIGCNKFGTYICEDCKKNIYPVTQDNCPYCLKPSYLGLKHTRCKGELDGSISILLYKGFTKKVIKTIKYKLITSVWEEFTTCFFSERLALLQKFKVKFPNAELQIIPLHPDRQKQRGFNQASYLATYISNLLSYKSINVLKRKRNTKPQAQLKNKFERFENLKDAFYIYKDSSNKIIILLDDVYTTGNTCKEAAKLLKNNGALLVFAITIAKD